ncbi:MAG: RNA pseudouridine synthase [Polyangiaceae bacterium]|nr:RNA pseudouridine synthase [Myxococcales bacterium]MCB9588109.1 RNA pseudouridine synthase [Polyangiaceae bacterium]
MARRGLTATRAVQLEVALKELLQAAGELDGGEGSNGDALRVALLEGRVFLEGRRLAEGTELTSTITPGQRLELGAPAQNTDEAPRVLDERWGLLAVYKPSGLASEPDQRSNDSVLERLEGSLGQRLHALSRLDAQVSGVMLLTTETARKRAAELMASGAIERRYVGIVGDGVEPESGTWRGAIGAVSDARSQRGKRRVGGRDAKPAVTHYRTLQCLPEAAAALQVRRGRERLELRPVWLGFRLETGRTHQIRVHCAHAGAPLLGDGLYGGAAAVTLPRGNVFEFERIGLHALGVSVVHAGSTWRVDCPPPPILERWWSAFGGEPASLDDF